jgi:threonine aldolase
VDRIDLRSDTVTWPTPAMREAMATAVVGDDVFGEDPTVNALEATAAAMFGKEAGLFVVSGTMANLVAILAQCGRGDEAILGDKAHTFNHEVGSVAALGGIQPHPVPVQADGTFRLDDIRAAICDVSDVHYPITRLIALENAQCGVGGMPLTAHYTAQVAAIAREHDLKLHIDGSRIFNAAVALDCSVADLAAPADTVSFCLAKGLSAPVGALVVGSSDFVKQARRMRKALGGGMRQAGVIAAAGLVALREMPARLHEDHANARFLAEGLAQIPGINLDVEQVRINIIRLSLEDHVPLSAYEIANRLHTRGILVGPRDARSFRLVTHHWITRDAVRQVIKAFEEVMA